MVRPNMAFTFIHTADWQIGRAFGRFDAELGPQLRLARLGIIDRIAEHAQSEGAKHVLVAGDVWDQDTPSDRTLHATLERLQRASHVTWWLLPGNHDPARPNGLWDRLQNTAVFALPSNVKVLLTSTAVAIEPDVYVLPAPWLSTLSGTDLTAWMDDCATPDGALRIGLAHGSVHGFGGEDTNAAEIAATRADTAQLDYLALGDWHGVKQVNGRTWYAGTPEPDRFPRNQPGYCLSVKIPKRGAAPKVTPLKTATYTWLRKDIDVSPGMVSADIVAEALEHAPPNQQTLLQLTLNGRIRAQDLGALQRDAAKINDAIAYLDLRHQNLVPLIETGDLDRLDHGGSLRAAGEDLMRRAENTALSDEQRQSARHALALLFAFATDQSDGAEA